MPSTPARKTRRPKAEVSLPVVQEDLRVSTEQVSTGALRVRIEQVDETHQVDLQATLHAVDLQRVPVNQEVDQVREPYSEGDVLVVPVYEETLVLQRRLVLKEEWRIQRTAEHRQWTEPVVLRRDQPRLERRDGEGRWVPDDAAPTEPRRDAAGRSPADDSRRSRSSSSRKASKP
jgi:uncharacterized protein (TIGR02271 family)